MLEILGKPRRTCEWTGSVGYSRRQVLQAGGGGLLGLNLPQVLAAQAADPFRNARAKNVVFLFLFGGPAQHETFDMKPEAADTIRGPFKPIACRTPGLLISEHLPRTAAVSDKFSVIRTMSHSYNDHSGGGHYIQTGHRWSVRIGQGFNRTSNDWPSMGSVVEYLGQKQFGVDGGMPNYFVLPNSLGRLQDYRVKLTRPGEIAGWLGRGYDPITTRIEKRDAKDNPYWRDCTDEELTFRIEGLANHEALTLDRLDRRQSLLRQFDQQRHGLSDAHINSYDRFQQRLALLNLKRVAFL